MKNKKQRINPIIKLIKLLITEIILITSRGYDKFFTKDELEVIKDIELFITCEVKLNIPKPI